MAFHNLKKSAKNLNPALISDKIKRVCLGNWVTKMRSTNRDSGGWWVLHTYRQNTTTCCLKTREMARRVKINDVGGWLMKDEAKNKRHLLAWFLARKLYLGPWKSRGSQVETGANWRKEEGPGHLCTIGQKGVKSHHFGHIYYLLGS